MDNDVLTCSNTEKSDVFYEINRRIDTEVALSVGDLLQFNEIESWNDDKKIIPSLRELTLSLASKKKTQPKIHLLPHQSQGDG